MELEPNVRTAFRRSKSSNLAENSASTLRQTLPFSKEQTNFQHPQIVRTLIYISHKQEQSEQFDIWELHTALEALSDLGV